MCGLNIIWIDIICYWNFTSAEKGEGVNNYGRRILMPMLKGLSFAKNNLKVSYCASDKPQVLNITVKNKRKQSCKAEDQIFLIDHMANTGIAGGSTFEPLKSKWEVSAKDKKTVRNVLGPQFSWKRKVTAIDPLFLRSVVEQLRFCGTGGVNQNPVVEMSVIGELPLDNGDLSITEKIVYAWLNDPSKYVGEWQDPGFIINQKNTKTNKIRLTVNLKKSPSSKEYNLLNDIAFDWSMNVINYVSTEGKKVTLGAGFLPIVKKIKRGLTADYNNFQFVRIPARALIVNALASYQKKYGLIESVDLVL
jgi:hypothetical protein